MEIPAPKTTEKALEKLLDKMYISNVSKRLRELNQPSDIDRKRWIWELLQNAKDTISNNPARNTVRAKIIIDGELLKFQHDGDPFTADARLGLLYKYSEDKENAESTGRFGTGFLTTHCLSRIVSIESNMYGDENKVIGFSVTMYRDGSLEQELLEGLDKMRKSQRYESEPYGWTTFEYHINSESGRRAIKLGIDNFKENIAQTLLFCKELSSVELIDNGEYTTIERIVDDSLADNIFITKFKITIGSSRPIIRTFIYCSYEEPDEDLTAKYKTNRSIRIQAACEVDDNCNILSTGDSTSLFCVFPLVGIEGQIQMPIFVNSPDFEPDSERQSLLLNGDNRDEERNLITETGINKKILEKVPKMFKNIVELLSKKSYKLFFNLCNGLKTIKGHEKLDKDWYKEKVVDVMREVFSSVPVVEPCLNDTNQQLRTLSNCLFIREDKLETEDELLNLVKSLYPSKLVNDNNSWSHALWKNENLHIWSTKELCADIESKGGLDSLILLPDENKIDWYNKFLSFVISKDELLLKEHALLPNMCGVFLKKDSEGFKQGEHMTNVVLDILERLGGEIRPLLLHEGITAITLDSKFNSTSYSAKVDSLSKDIIDEPSSSLADLSKLTKLLPLIAIRLSDSTKYESEFIAKRENIFSITKDLFGLNEFTPVSDNSLNKAAWDSLDSWLVKYIITTIESKKSLDKLPDGLTAKWINKVIYDLGISLSILNSHAIVPNQNGNFCLDKDLFIDGGVPDILKHEVFDKIELSYKDILLDNDIDLSPLGENRSKDISSFASDLSDSLLWSESYQSNYPYRSYGHYRKFDEKTLRAVSQYLIQILPFSEASSIYSTQKSLRDIAIFFLGAKYEGNNISIEISDNKLWTQVNEFICCDIVSLIEEKGSMSRLVKDLDKDEDSIIESLNVLYQFIEGSSIPLTTKYIYPNQAGLFVQKDILYRECEVINEQLKEIIALICDDKDNYYNILVDLRCKATIPKQKNCAETYTLIDDTIKKLYDSPVNWESENFRKAARLLIEEWGESNKNLFDENHFPKTWPIRDSISMNVVWTKNERQQLQILKSNLDEAELTDLVARIDNIKTLNLRNQQLEDENARLRQEIEELKRIRNAKIDFGEDELSEKKQFEAQLEAQNKMIETFGDIWIFPENYGGSDENGKPHCNSTIQITEKKSSRIFPIVVKSYRDMRKPFKFNPPELDSILRDNAELYVYTYKDGVLGIVKIPEPKKDLIMRQSNVSISFNSMNFNEKEHCDRLLLFSDTLHYFESLHFNFDYFNIPSNAKVGQDIYSKTIGMQDQTTDADV